MTVLENIRLQPDSYDRLNAANAAAGWPPIEDYAGIDAAATAMLTQNTRHAALAEETIEAHRHQKFLHGGARVYAHEPRAGQLYAILARSPYKLYPTPDPETLAAQKLWPYKRCDARLSRRCEQSNAQRTLCLHRGDYVCCYRSCTPCAGWFNTDEPPARKLRLDDDYRALYADNITGGTQRPKLKVVAPTRDEVHQMAPTIHAWAQEGNDAFEADVAARVAAGEDPTSARQFVKAEAEWHIAKELDRLREEDPQRANELFTFMRRICAEFGKPVPYPFN